MSVKSDTTPVSFLFRTRRIFLSSTARIEGVSFSLNDLKIKLKGTSPI